MERVRQRDLRALLEYLGELYALRQGDGFAEQLVRTLPGLIPSEITSYTTADFRQWRVVNVLHPADAPGKEIVDRRNPDHPLIAHCFQQRDADAIKVSDLLTRSEWHRAWAYNLMYRPAGMEHQMAVRLRRSPSSFVAVSAVRRRPDFTERERLLLNLLRPHLCQASENAEAVARVQEELGLLRAALEAAGGGLVALAPRGRVRQITPAAQAWLAEYFNGGARVGARLPDAVSRWVRHAERQHGRTDDLPPPRAPLVVERGGKRLVVRLLRDGAEPLLLLEEQGAAPDSGALDSFGLTRREAEVLAWVAEGKTNPEIGTILGSRPRTVAKHLERIYAKLGVETRTAAARLALAAPRVR